jgi:hypothetical protein
MQSGNEFRVQNHVRHGRLVGMVVSCLVLKTIYSLSEES